MNDKHKFKKPTRAELVAALDLLQSAIGDETLHGGERIRKSDVTSRLCAPRLNGAIVAAKDVLWRERVSP